MLAFALVPTVSRALAFAQGSGWVEVCTSQGAQRIAAAIGDADTPAPPHAVLDHCPLCTLAAGTGALLPASGAAWPAMGLAQRPLVGIDEPPGALQVWAAALPRAPPQRG